MHWLEASLSEDSEERVEPPVEPEDREEPVELAGLLESCLKSSMVAVENWLLSSSTGDMV